MMRGNPRPAPQERHSSPFARPSAAQRSTDDASTRYFARLKPTCVQLLGLANPSGLRSAQLVTLLNSLRSELDSITSDSSTSSRPPLSPALINYVFFPLAQLLRTPPTGAAGLPSRVRQEVFACLACLARDWWIAFEKPGAVPATAASPGASTNASDNSPWRVWEQLLMLGAVALGGPPRPQGKPAPATPSPSSAEQDETRLAIVSFLTELLKPRADDPEVKDGASMDEGQDVEEIGKDWEWDGESELPSLDDLEIEEEKAKAKKREAAAAKLRTEKEGKAAAHTADISPTLRYPAPAHLALADCNQASRGALTHALTTALTIATEAPPQYRTSAALRLASLKLGRLILVTWLAAPSEGVQRRADRSAIFLPGFVSTCVRVVLNQARSSQQEVNEGLAARRDALAPGPLAAEAIAGLGEALRATINDEASAELLPGREEGHDQPASTEKEGTAPASLAELVERAKEMDLESDGKRGARPGPALISERDETATSARKSTASTPSDVPKGQPVRTRDWLEHTLAQIHVSLTSIASVSEHTSSAVQAAVVNLSESLLTSCGRTLAWGDEVEGRASIFKGRGEEDMTSDTVQLLLRLLCDVAAGSQSSASSAKRAREVLSAFCADEVHGAAGGPDIKGAVAHEMSSCVRQLPRSVLDQHEDLVVKLSHRFSELARLSSTSASVRGHLESLVGKGSRPQAWAHKLLEALEVSTEELTRFDSDQDEMQARFKPLPLKHVGPEASKAVSSLLRSLGFAMAQTAIKGAGEVTQAGGSGSERSFGSSSTGEPFFLLHFLVGVAREMRADAWSAPSGGGTSALLARRSTAAFMLVDELLRGVSEVLADDKTKLWSGKEGRRAKKVAQRLADQVTQAALEVWDADGADKVDGMDGAVGEDGQTAPPSASQALLRQEDGQPSQLTVFQRGLAGEEGSTASDTQSFSLGPAINTSPFKSTLINDASKPQESRSGILLRSQRTAVAHLKAGDAFLLSILGSGAVLQGPGFSKHLLRALYLLISGSSAVDASIREAAVRALRVIATSTRHSDVREVVLGHLDYLLGAASHRLISGLGEELERLTAFEALARASDTPEAVLVLRRAQPLTSALGAPLVLVEIIRMLGSDAVPLVQDAVDEVLEAIDRFHGHEQICDGLLNVVDSIVGIMAREERDKAERRRIEQSAKGHGSRAGTWSGPHPEKDLDDLRTWIKLRQGKPVEDPSPYDGDAPTSPSRAARGVEESEPNAPSASQASVAAMLRKGVPFLSHSSAIIRARMLRLLRSGVEVLAPQGRESDVVPVLLSAWPFILARLGRSASSGPSSGQSTPVNPFASIRPSRLSASEATKRLARLSETEPFVWLEAASLLSVLAELLPDFFGRKVQEEAWERLDTLVRIAVALEGLESRDDATRKRGITYLLGDSPRERKSGGGKSGKPISSNAGRSRTFRPQHAHSLATKLLMATLRTLSSLLAHHGTSIPERAAWKMMTHPELLASLDERQPEALRGAARDFYRAAAARNEDAAWVVLRKTSSVKDGCLHWRDARELRLPGFQAVMG